MFYTELPPHPALAQHVRCIWVFESGASDAFGSPVDELQTIVPDGHPELLLHYGDLFSEVSNDVTVVQSRALFAGQIAQPLVLQPGATAGVIGVRFRPAGARALLGMSMAENTDCRLDLTQVWGRDAELLLEEVHAAHDADGRARVVERFLIRRLANARLTPDAALSACIEQLHLAGGGITVDALAARCQLSGRQLERRFLREVGIPPRLLASIFRFRRLFDLLEQGQTGRWSDAALSAGYFDQAHMIRDFKRFAGLQPQAFHDGLAGLSAAMVGAADEGARAA